MLSQKIKKYRLDNGLTQEELAKALHSSQNTISNYENGIRTPTVKKVMFRARVRMVCKPSASWAAWLGSRP